MVKINLLTYLLSAKQERGTSKKEKLNSNLASQCAHLVFGDVTEKFGLEREIAKDACLRELDDYSPRKQLEKKMMGQCGEPMLEVAEEVHSDAIINFSDH